MLSYLYFKSSFNTNSPGSLRSARVLVPLITAMVQPASVIDFGCGGGSWLKAFEENGINDLLGVDGPWIDRKVFRLAPELLRYHDLTKPLEVGRRYDLASCLEVAEHLPAEAAPVLVANLVALAPVVAFSAAVPAQFGKHHVNCQWPEYWAALFDRFNYRPLDVLRWQVWDNSEVAWWYRQNLILYVAPSFIEAHTEFGKGNPEPERPLRVIHPDCFGYHADPSVVSLRRYMQSFPRVAASSMGRAVKRLLGRPL
jgi:SAM-dependent methyltransferase